MEDIDDRDVKHTRCNTHDVLLLSFKVRKILCEQLASILGVTKASPPPSRDDKQTEDRNNILDESFTSQVESSSAYQPTANVARSDPALVKIRDILRERDRIEEEEQAKAQNEAAMKREWMLAARVFNRLCFMFFTITLSVVTTAFFFVCHLHYIEAF